jgi:hypothetical protein
MFHNASSPSIAVSCGQQSRCAGLASDAAFPAHCLRQSSSPRRHLVLDRRPNRLRRLATDAWDCWNHGGALLFGLARVSCGSGVRRCVVPAGRRRLAANDARLGTQCLADRGHREIGPVLAAAPTSARGYAAPRHAVGGAAGGVHRGSFLRRRFARSADCNSRRCQGLAVVARNFFATLYAGMGFAPLLPMWRSPLASNP